MKKTTLLILLLLVLLFLSGCYAYVSKFLTTRHITKLPSFPRAYQIQEDDSFPDAKQVSKVINIFYSHWKAEFGDESERVSETLNSIMIDWGEKPKRGSGHSLQGRSLNGVIRGITMTPGYIWVWKGVHNKLSSTSLVHELIHCAIWANNSHCDPDHEGTEYEGWTRAHTEFLFKINYLLEDMNM